MVQPCCLVLETHPLCLACRQLLSLKMGWILNRLCLHASEAVEALYLVVVVVAAAALAAVAVAYELRVELAVHCSTVSVVLVVFAWFVEAGSKPAPAGLVAASGA